LWSLVTSLVQRVSLPEEERALAELAIEAAGRVGAPVLEASTLEDLRQRVGQAACTEDLAKFSQKAAELLTIGMIEEASTRLEPSEALDDVLGSGPARKLKDFYRLVSVAASVLFQILASAVQQGSAVAVGATGLELVYDNRVPQRARECVLQGMRADVYVLAIVQAVAAGKRLDPWLALAIVENLVACQRDRVRLLASLPGVAVPEDVISVAERIDFDQAERESEAVEGTIARWVEAAEVSGEDVYFPASDASDEYR
jgi:hypothetical protein